MKSDLHVGQIIDSLGPGGAEALIVTFAETAQTKGIKVTVISLSDNMDKGHNTNIARLNALGITVYSIPSRKLYELRPMLALVRIIRQEHFDVIQTHLSHGNILGAFAGWITRTPVVATLHNPAPRRIGHYAIREFIWNIVLKYMVHRVIAVSRVVEAAYRDVIGASKIDLVLNAVKIGEPLLPAEKEAVRREVLNDSSKPFVLCVGRLVTGKGLFELLSALKNVVNKFPNVMLVFAGDGDLRNSLEAEAERLCVKDSVFFLGMRNDIPRLLRAADIYISASFSEGMSIALLEAMSAGLPIIATEVGEAPYLLAEGRGVLIPSRDVSAIEAGLCQLLDDPANASIMGLTVREYAKYHCSPDIWLEHLMKVYFKAMGVQQDG